jgi:hypothetical protein
MHFVKMENNDIGLQVSRQTPTLVLSLTSAMILANSENLEPKIFLVFSCVQKSALCEWEPTALYHVFQKYCHSFSGSVCPVNTFRNQSNRTFAGRCTKCGAWTFGIYNKHINQNRKEIKKNGTESCTTPNPALRTSASHP